MRDLSSLVTAMTDNLPACWDVGVLRFRHGSILERPEGFVVGAVWPDRGTCGGGAPKAVHIRLLYTTWNPHHPPPNWCDETAEREIANATWTISGLPIPSFSKPQPGCHVLDKGTLHRGNPENGVCSFVTWAWDCDVECMCKGKWTTGPDSTCVTPETMATIQCHMGGDRLLPEDLFVRHKVEYSD